MFREGLTRLFLQRDFNTTFPSELQLKILNSIKVVRVKEIHTSIYVRVPPMTCLNKDETPKAKDFLQMKEKDSATIYVTWDLSDKVQRSNAKQRVVELLLSALAKGSPNRDEISNHNSLLNLLTLDPKEIHPFLDLQNVPDIPNRGDLIEPKKTQEEPKPDEPKEAKPKDNPEAPETSQEDSSKPQKAVSKSASEAKPDNGADTKGKGDPPKQPNPENPAEAADKKPVGDKLAVQTNSNERPSDKGKEELPAVPRGPDGTTHIQNSPVSEIPHIGSPHDGPIIQTIVRKNIKDVQRGGDEEGVLVLVPNLEPVNVPQQAPDMNFDTSARIPDIPENLLLPPVQEVMQDEQVEDRATAEGVQGTAQTATLRMEEMIRMVFEEIRGTSPFSLPSRSFSSHLTQTHLS